MICTTRQPASSPTSQHDEARDGLGASRLGLVLRERPPGLQHRRRRPRARRVQPRSCRVRRDSACTSGDGTAPRTLPGEVAFGPSHGHPLRRLILHNDLRIGRDRVRWHLVNPLAYDIADGDRGDRVADPSGPLPAQRRVPGRVRPGGALSTLATTSRRTAGYPVSLNYDEFNQMWRQVRAMRPLRMASVGHLVDLDNLTRWFIATVFCATNDAYQGPGQFRDPTRESAQWFWVNWDMDQSFRQPEQDTFWYLLSRTGRPRGAAAQATPDRAFW